MSYMVIFIRHVSNKQRVARGHISAFQVFKRSRFYVSLLLIASFLLLMMVPLLVYALSRITHHRLPNSAALYVDCSILLADTADAVIYVFLHRPVFQLLQRKGRSLAPQLLRETTAMSFLLENLLWFTLAIRYLVRKSCSDGKELGRTLENVTYEPWIGTIFALRTTWIAVQFQDLLIH